MILILVWNMKKVNSINILGIFTETCCQNSRKLARLHSSKCAAILNHTCGAMSIYSTKMRTKPCKRTGHSTAASTEANNFHANLLLLQNGNLPYVVCITEIDVQRVEIAIFYIPFGIPEMNSQMPM